VGIIPLQSIIGDLEFEPINIGRASRRIRKAEEGMRKQLRIVGGMLLLAGIAVIAPTAVGEVKSAAAAR